MTEPIFLPPGNPFPGMDPWMQRSWPGHHAKIISLMGDRLQGRLPDGLRADIETRVFVASGEEIGDPFRRTVTPDNSLAEADPFAGGGGGTAVLERPVTIAVPEVVLLTDHRVFQHSLEIRTVDGEQVVTALELLSPTNKRPGEGRDSYLFKQDDYMAADVNVVEIDLTRGGRRPMIGPPPRVDDPAYAVNVWRAERPRCTEFYRIGLRDPLPAFRVPLRPADADVTLELQPIVDAAHRKGAAHKLDHARPLDPPLSPADTAWANELIAAARAASNPKDVR